MMMTLHCSDAAVSRKWRVWDPGVGGGHGNAAPQVMMILIMIMIMIMMLHPRVRAATNAINICLSFILGFVVSKLFVDLSLAMGIFIILNY